jgi:hypothetical protein
MVRTATYEHVCYQYRQLLSTLLESLTEEQLRQFVSIFTDEQRLSFFGIYEAYRKRNLSGEGEAKDESEPQEPQAAEAGHA